MTEPITLAIVIMAHPARRARAELLAEWVKAETIVWDHLGKGEWDTGARAWAAGLEYHTSHILVLQDDAEPVQSLRKNVIAAIEHSGSTPISLYLGRKKPTKWVAAVQRAVDEADASGAHWIAASHLLHGVAVVLASKWVRPMLDWAEMSRAPYDQRIGRYIRECQSKGVLYTWPSLVDHAEIPSLVRHRDDKRTSTDGRIAHRVGVPESWAPIVVMVDTPENAER